jgi:tetratricopeptide (TPR) repeat protein
VEKAIGYCEQALVIDREIGDRHGEGVALGNLGLAYKNLGEVAKAQALLRQAKSIGEQIRDPQIVRITTSALEALSKRR